VKDLSGQLFYGSRWLSPLDPDRPLQPQIDPLNRAPEHFGFDYVGWVSCDSTQPAGPGSLRTRRNLSWGGE